MGALNAANVLNGPEMVRIITTAIIASQKRGLVAVIAVLLGGYVLWARKGSTRHKLLGRIWVLVMVFVAVTSFFIHQIRMIGLFSPIHLLSILTLVGLARAIYIVRLGRIAKHQQAMKMLYFGALIVPGLFTLMPGRLMFGVVIGPWVAVESLYRITPLDGVMIAFVGVVLVGLAFRYVRAKRAL